MKFNTTVVAAAAALPFAFAAPQKNNEARETRVVTAKEPVNARGAAVATGTVRYVHEGQTMRVYDTLTPAYTQYITAQASTFLETSKHHGKHHTKTVVQFVVAPSPYLSTAFVTQIYEANSRPFTGAHTFVAGAHPASTVVQSAVPGIATGGAVTVQTGVVVQTGSVQGGAHGNVGALPVAALPAGTAVQGGLHSGAATVQVAGAPHSVAQAGSVVQGGAHGGSNGGVMAVPQGVPGSAAQPVAIIQNGASPGSHGGVAGLPKNTPGSVVQGGTVPVQGGIVVPAAQGQHGSALQGGAVPVQTGIAIPGGAPTTHGITVQTMVHGPGGTTHRITNIRVVAGAATPTAGAPSATVSTSSASAIWSVTNVFSTSSTAIDATNPENGAPMGTGVPPRSSSTSDPCSGRAGSYTDSAGKAYIVQSWMDSNVEAYMGHTPSSGVAGCFQLCDSDSPRCKGFTFVDANQNCYLKDSVGTFFKSDSAASMCSAFQV